MTLLDDVAFKHLFSGEINKAEEIWKKRECASSLQNLIACALVRNDYAFAISCAETLYSDAQYVEQLVSAVTGTGGNSDAEKLAYSFLDILCEKFGAGKLLLFVTNASWKNHIGEKTVKPLIESISDAIDVAKKSKGKGPKARLNAGERLRKDTRNAILQLKNFLSSTDLQYQIIADKLGLEILQCGIDFYNDSDETDAALKAMNLQKYAKSIVVGQMAKDRCKENVDILQKIIEALPPSEVFAEDKVIREELRKYCLLPDKICHAVTLLNNTKPQLQAIKRKLGATNAYYLKISTQIVGNALSNVIAEVNGITKKSCIKEVLKNAWQAILIMDAFDFEAEFKNKIYNKNRISLEDMRKQFYLTSKRTSSCVIAAFIVNLLCILIGYILASSGERFDNTPMYWSFGFGLASWYFIYIDRSDNYSIGEEGFYRGGCVGILLFIPCFVEYWIYKFIRWSLDVIQSYFIRRFILGIILIMGSQSIIASSLTNDVRIKELEMRCLTLQKSLEQANNKFNDFADKQKNYEHKIQVVTLKNTIQSSRIDSLENSYNHLENAQSIDRKSLNGKIDATDNNVRVNQDMLQARTLWGIFIVIVFLAIIVSIAYQLTQRIKSGNSTIADVRKAQEMLQAAQAKMQEESIKLDNQLLTIVQKQLETSTSSTSKTTGEPDHTLVVKLADEIARIETNLSKMDKSVRGYKQLVQAKDRMINNVRANGYEIISLLGQEYNDGMQFHTRFVPDESLPEGKRIITGMIKMQVNYNGKMIQPAEIVVSQNI